MEFNRLPDWRRQVGYQLACRVIIRVEAKRVLEEWEMTKIKWDFKELSDEFALRTGKTAGGKVEMRVCQGTRTVASA